MPALIPVWHRFHQKANRSKSPTSTAKERYLYIAVGNGLLGKISELATPDSRVTGTPFFRDNGSLVIPIDYRNYERNDAGEWLATEKSSDDEMKVYHQQISIVVDDPFAKRGANPPAGCPVRNIKSLIYDSQGVCYINDKNGGLWKAVPGCAVQLIEGDAVKPISDSVSFHHVVSDRIGNTFICTEFAGKGKHVMIRARHKVPVSEVTVLKTYGNSVIMDLGPAAWKRYRIDNGEWSLATDELKYRIDDLVPGEHTIEVLAYNVELTSAQKSAVAKFSITALPAAEIDGLIADLGSMDLAKMEAAAKLLRNQGSTVLPTLRKALSESKDESQQWWIKTVIQHLEVKRDSR